MTARSILQVFDNYQKARIQFVQTVADLALRPQNIEYLEQARALDLLQPLLNDVCPQIQQCAAIAIGRLVNHDANLARQVLNRNFLPLLLRDIEKQNKYYKKAVLFVLRALCKHDEEMATFVSSSGGLEALILCLEDFEPMVKQGAAWGIGYMARHSENLAQNVVDVGAIPLLMLCLQEPELTLKQVAANALADIAKHSPDLAQNIVDAGAVPHLARSLTNQDEKLKRQVLTALTNIAKHTNDLAEVVVEAEVFPSVLTHMAHACPIVRKNAATLVRDIVKHSLELTQLIVNTGGIGALMLVLQHTSEESKIPCITAVGYIAGHSDQLALSVVGCNGVLELTRILNESTDDATLAVTAWTLGQIGKHSPEHAKSVAAANAFPRLLHLYMDSNSSEDLKFKAKSALKHCLQKCMLLSALEPLLFDAPLNIMKYILGQFSKFINLAMADTQRRRSRNFTEFEKELLLDIVMKYIHIIENKKTDAKTIQDKNECWRRVTEEFNAKSFNGARMYAQLRMLYDNLKKNARKDNTGEKVKSKAVEKLITMLTVPYDVLPTPQIDNTIYNNPKFDGSEFSIEDTDHNKEVVLNAMPIRDSNSAQQALISSFKSEKVLPNDPKARRLFVTTGGLKKVQEIDAEPGSTLMEYIAIINACFPEEIVRYYSPGYPDSLLDSVEQYSPQVMTILRDVKTRDSDMQANIEATINEATSPTTSQQLHMLLEGK